MAPNAQYPGRWPSPKYVVRVRFDAPLDFVFRWCTDYGAADAALEGEKYERRVIDRSKRRVIYEDLEDLDGGWFWTRHEVELSPPDHWHSESIGSHRAYSLDYQLRRRGPSSTELTLTARRKPYGHGGPNPPKAKWERDVSKSWKLFAQHLESDFRAAKRKRPS